MATIAPGGGALFSWKNLILYARHGRAGSLFVQDCTEGLRDYKLLCFNGQVKMSFVCTERYATDGLKVTFFDKDWKRMPFERHYRASSAEIQKPLTYGSMIRFAEKLSIGIPFVRVDFYETKGRTYFGELTFYPGSGYEEFNPEEWDRKLGDCMQLQ